MPWGSVSDYTNDANNYDISFHCIPKDKKQWVCMGWSLQRKKDPLSMNSAREW